MFVVLFLFGCAEKEPSEYSSSILGTESIASEPNTSNRDPDESSSETSASMETKETSVSVGESFASESSSLIPSIDSMHPIALRIIGSGEGSTGVALFVSTSFGVDKELNTLQAITFLAKIDFTSFIEANANQDIPLPDGMGNEVDFNYISVGMPHTGTLYILQDYPQAVLYDAEGKIYYDVPADTYNKIIRLL